jgi:FMN-dependent NADH-azoreductase
MNILQVNSSARAFRDGQGSVSTALANELVAALRTNNPRAGLRVRDLALDPHPVLDEASLVALGTPAAQRSAEQAARVALDDALIAEVQAADVIVLGVPMYNFTISTQLKSWIDAIARAGVTFRYTEQGPEGLLKGKKVYAVLSRGGVHRDAPTDTQVPYLEIVLGFLGLDDVEFVYAEGLALGPAAAADGLAAARAQIVELIDQHQAIAA